MGSVIPRGLEGAMISKVVVKSDLNSGFSVHMFLQVFVFLPGFLVHVLQTIIPLKIIYEILHVVSIRLVILIKQLDSEKHTSFFHLFSSSRILPS